MQKNNKIKRILSALLVLIMGASMTAQSVSAFAGGPSTISVGLAVGTSCAYGSYSTRYYSDTTNNNSYAYCVQPSKASPASATYTADRTDIRGMRAILYYGYGGPGFNDPDYGAKMIFNFSDSQVEAKRLPYAYTHTLAALAYYGGDWNAMGSSIQQGMTDLKEAFSNVYSFYTEHESSVPGGFTAYTFNTGSTQTMTTWRYIPEGYVNVKKTSANPALTDGNSCYSFSGAQFGVFMEQSCTNQVATLTTDASGESSASALTEGTYYVKELAAPKGFALSEEVKAVNVVSGQTATVTFADKPQADPVGVLLGKVDKETNQNKPQGSASLAGAEFTVKFYDGFYDTDPAIQGKAALRTWVLKTDADGYAELNNAYKVSGDDFFYNGTNIPTLPIGTVTIQESKAPTGYLINSEVYVRQIVSDGSSEFVYTYNQPIIPEQTIRGGVKIAKMDSEKGRSEAQGAAALGNAEFSIVTLNENPVVVEGKEYSRGQVVKTIVTDEVTHIASTDADTLPYGDYKIYESKSPSGYLLEGAPEREFSITRNGEIVDLTGKDDAVPDDVIRGGVKISKMDSEKGRSEAQGGAALGNAEFSIVTLNENSVMVEGKEYSRGQVVKTIVTDEATHTASTDADTLPYGDYKIFESKSPSGYLMEGTLEREFSITRDGVIVDLTGKDTAILNDVIRGGVRIQKRDLETGEAEAQGGAGLGGTQIEITSLNRDTVIVDGREYSYGQTVKTLITDEPGTAETEPDAFPYGDYAYKETVPPDGYLPEGILEGTFSIREDGVIVDLTPKESSIYNQVKRGDIEGVKISAVSHKRLAGVPFQLTSTTTGESHTVVTDANGQFSTSAEWASHKQNTNRGTTSEDGVWFGTSEPDDSRGALLYDTYLVEELRCEANKDMKLIPPFEITVSRNKYVIHLGTLTDEYEQIPEIQTSAAEKDTGAKKITEAGNVTITDTVTLTGLTKGTRYLLKGSEMLKNEDGSGTQLTADGVPVTAEKSFTATDHEMVLELDFTFNARRLGGNSLVTFEELYDVSNPDLPVMAAEHKDMEDEGQTVSIAERNIDLHTMAAEKDTGAKEITEAGNVTITDTVTLTGLEPGGEYRLKGWQMTEGKHGEGSIPLVIDGAMVENELIFTAEGSEMEVPMDFTFNARGLGGTKLVTFEELYDRNGPGEEEPAAEHKDMEDAGQTVVITERSIGMHTMAAEKDTGAKEITEAGNVTITDTVTLTGLEPGGEYRLKGWQMLKDEESGQGTQLLTDGVPVERELVFTATESEMEVPLDFTFNARGLGKSTLVTFEELYDRNGPGEEERVAEHKDMEDAGQTVVITERSIGMHTVAAEKDTGAKKITEAGNVTITDTVTLAGLEEGVTYCLKGAEMRKGKDGKAEQLVVDGVPVTNELIFTAEKSEMEISLDFTFNAGKLGGTELVAFEELYDLTDPDEPEKVAEHTDADDEGQTVTIGERVIEIETTAADKATGMKLVAAGEATITDTVKLKGLEPGVKYVLKGSEMLKGEGKEGTKLVVDGVPVENELAFTAEKSEMELALDFTVDASELGGKKLVAFEELYDLTNPDEPELVAEHTDIEDKNQTVIVQEIPETPEQPKEPERPEQPKKPKTGDNAPVAAAAGTLVISGAVLAGLMYFRRKRNKNE